MGGVDLSYAYEGDPMSPRAPAHGVGVDVSEFETALNQLGTVPARVGGVDLSIDFLSFVSRVFGPRPCGRGGFKQGQKPVSQPSPQSPPVWAGWI